MPDQDLAARITAALAGPWKAVISHRGEAYDSLRTARIELGPDGEVDISVRRGSALPHEDDDGYLPGSYSTGDMAYELDGVWLDDEDPSIGAEARFAQAQAMAAGLNAAFSATTQHTLDFGDGFLAVFCERENLLASYPHICPADVPNSGDPS